MVIKSIRHFLNKRISKQSRQSASNHKPSLTHTTLLNMALRVTGVMLVSAWVSYSHVMGNLEGQTKKRLEQYIVELGQKQSLSFRATEENNSIIKQEFLTRLQAIDEQSLKSRFDQLFVLKTDGTFRTRQELYYGKSQPNGSIVQYMNGVIFKKPSLDANLQRQVVISYDLLSAYAPALRKELESIYMFIWDGSGMAYSPSVAWNLKASANEDFSQQEWAYTADVQHNPTRSIVWTGLYYEPVSKTFLVTCLTPIDVPGYLPMTIGSDLSINELLEQTVQDHLEGAYNIIFRADGRLIAHPQLMDELEAKQGNLSIQDTDDAHLKRIFQMIKRADQNQNVLNNKKDGEFLAITRITGPDWYLITVYPKSLLFSFAFETVQFILISGLVALLIEIGLLFSVLRQQIEKPLKQLLTATDSLSGGNFDIHLDTKRRDELGQLANSFNTMASQLNSLFTELESANIDLEKRVEERTIELKNTLCELQRAQSQMVQTEKMSALGQMVAGIAHEINNPVNFIHGNMSHVDEYTKDLRALIFAYQQHYPNPPRSLQNILDTIEFDFLTEDLDKILQSMRVGTNRICEIIKSLRNFSRLDEADFKSVDVHDGINNTLMILRHRLKTSSDRSEIEVIKEYESLPLIECYAGQLNQVFMNVLSNAIDAIDERYQKRLFDKNTDSPDTIQIHTEVIQNRWISIRITDSGIGMSESVKASIFDPFFTTKPVGKGTGLGLSISYRVITEKHGGRLWCESTPGQGTTFVIEMPIRQTVPVMVQSVQ